MSFTTIPLLLTMNSDDRYNWKLTAFLSYDKSPYVQSFFGPEEQNEETNSK
jgi:hypothetical protein